MDTETAGIGDRDARSKNETDVLRYVIGTQFFSLALILLIFFFFGTVLSSRVQFFNP